MNRPTLALLAAGTILAAACGGGAPPPARQPAPSKAPAPDAPMAPISLATGYRATALMERTDTITLSVPGGGKQVTSQGRHARFSIDVNRDGRVRIRLDSLALRPSTDGRERKAVGTVWQGQLTANGLEELHSNASSQLIADIGERVRQLFPAIPGDGVLPGERWSDTTDATRQVEVFEAQEHRVRHWEAGERSPRQGVQVQPIRLTERYEQVGSGQQAGREMRMSAQGNSSATY